MNKKLKKINKISEYIFSYTVLISVILFAMLLMIVFSILFFNGMGFDFEKKVSINDYISLLSVIVTGVLSYGIFNLTKKMNEFQFANTIEVKESIKKKLGIMIHSMAKSLTEIESAYEALYQASLANVENPINYTYEDEELSWRRFDFYNNKIFAGISNWKLLYKEIWTNPDLLTEIYELRDVLLEQDHCIKVIEDRFKVKFLEEQTMENLKKYNEYICEQKDHVMGINMRNIDGEIFNDILENLGQRKVVSTVRAHRSISNFKA